jgi:hypothetical protein
MNVLPIVQHGDTKQREVLPRTREVKNKFFLLPFALLETIMFSYVKCIHY